MDYVNNIKSTILETVNQYESDKTVDEALLREMIKLQSRDTSIKYSKAKTKKMKSKETDIEIKCYSRSLKAVVELYKQRQRSSCWTIEGEEKGIREHYWVQNKRSHN